MNSTANDHQALLAFVLEHALNEPNHRRIQLYRALSKICGDPQEEANLRSLADALESTEKLCRELNFSIVQKAQAWSSNPPSRR